MGRLASFVALVGLLLLLGGCGKDETVHVGAPGESGPIKQDIDTAKNVAGQANAKQDDDSKTLGDAPSGG